MAFKIFPLRLLETRHVTPSILHLVFSRDDGEELTYQAGQFINIHFDNDGKKIHRSYSIAN
ncbi:MAG: ferredoxin--NADP reductase, partial [Gammaproteobacteria bacterium]